MSSLLLRTYTPQSTSRLYPFPRAEGVPNKPSIAHDDWVCGPDPPARLPSKLPPPGNLTLSLILGDRIGSGRSGVVFNATIDTGTSSAEIRAKAIPPLVVKISRYNHHIDLLHEAFYYGEMECLQGVIVPRFYGLFQGRLPPGTSLFPPGERPDDARRLVPDPEPENEDSITEEQSSGKHWEDVYPGEDDGHTTSHLNSEDVQRLKDLKQDTSIVSILVLERLGGKLPIGEELPEQTV